jgi:hypothetical protein
MSVQIRALRRQQHRLNFLALEDVSERIRELRVTVHEHVRFALEEAILDLGQLPARAIAPYWVIWYE